MIPFKTRIKSGVVQRLEVIESLSFQGQELTPGAATDEKTKVSSNDTTAGFLNGKLVAGTGITLTENNNGGDETLTVTLGSHTHAAGDITTGTINTARLASTGTASSSTYLRGDQAWSGLNAGHITSGTVPTARLATGTANSTTYLRGDQTWQTIASGVTGFTPAIVTGAPNATTNVSHLLSAVTTTNGDIAIEPKGAGALIAQVPDSSLAGGTKRGQYSTDFQRHRTQSDRTASGQYAFIGSGSNNGASGNYSSISGGQSNVTSGSHASVSGGQSNTASGSHSFIGGGLSGTAGAAYAAVIGGNNSSTIGEGSVMVGSQSSTIATGCTNSGMYSTVSGSMQASSYQAVIIGGANQTNDGTSHYSAILGGQLNRINIRSPRSVVLGGYRAFCVDANQIVHASGGSASDTDGQHQFIKTVHGATTYSFTSGPTKFVKNLDNNWTGFGTYSSGTFFLHVVLVSRAVVGTKSACLEYKGLAVVNNSGSTITMPYWSGSVLYSDFTAPPSLGYVLGSMNGGQQNGVDFEVTSGEAITVRHTLYITATVAKGN